MMMNTDTAAVVSIPLFSGLVTDVQILDHRLVPGRSQSLCFQGWLLTVKALTPEDRAEMSQSLCFQGWLLTQYQVLHMRAGESQSLCFQGWLLTVFWSPPTLTLEVSIPLFSGLVTDGQCLST